MKQTLCLNKFRLFGRFVLLTITAQTLLAQAALAEPAAGISSPRKLNLNADWRFMRKDVKGAEKPNFDASNWKTVSCPHTWNDIDTFDNFGTGGHQGETELWKGTAWYRKAFSLSDNLKGKKIYIEFEGVRQIADVYLNGHHLGQDMTGFIPFGFDLTPHLNANGENIIAVKVNNTVDDFLTGDTPWNHQNWHPPHGGIYRNVSLHVLDPLHVTLPLYGNLGTEGIYAWTESLSKERATVGVTAEVENSNAEASNAVITFALVDPDGKVVSQSKKTTEVPAGGKIKVASHLEVTDPHLWEPGYPYVYQIRVEVSANGTTRDMAETPFGIRNFRFDVDNGFWINGRPLKLHGWGQKPGQGWAGLGTAIPNWMHDYTLKLMEEAGGNLIRWGHSAGPPVGVRSGDKYGFITLMPGVDGERDCKGRAWEIRSNAFRDMIIYYRNHPSIIIWEGGNYNVSPAHAKEIRAIKEKWDPSGRRYFGFRMSTPAMLDSLDIELGTIGRDRALPSLPIIETEYDRTETPRRVWDQFSPPDFGNLGKLSDKNQFNLASEGFATLAIRTWWDLFGKRTYHSGGANWIFSDGTHGTRQRTDVARATGEVDAVRLPKEAYWALQATWDDKPRVHLIGHWSYPKDTVKNMYAVAQADEVELFVNGRSLGKGERGFDTLFTWEKVTFEPGEIKVVAYRDGKEIASQRKETAGPPAALRLTAMTAPGGWRADGSDIALVDFEVVDAKGRRCPTDQDRVDFEIKGPGIWRGGYNSGKEGSTNHLYLDTECGINRVSIRSTLQAGEVTLIAKRKGLPAKTLRLKSLPTKLTGGILADLPTELPSTLPARPNINGKDLLKLAEKKDAPKAKPTDVVSKNKMFSMFAYTGEGAGGAEAQMKPGLHAYTDNAVLRIDEFPKLLKGTTVIRTANGDNDYWSNDYIVATAGRHLDLYVAHDTKVKVPKWLRSFKKTKEKLKIRGRTLAIYTKRLKKDENLNISGNADQGKVVKSAYNMILFCKPVSKK